MRGSATRRSGRSRALRTTGVFLLTCGLLLGAVAVMGPVGAQTGTPTQIESQNQTSADGQGGAPTEDGLVSPPVGVQNETVLPPSAENDTPSSGSPQAAPEANTQIVQGPEGAVTVAVAENESIRAGTSGSIELEVTNDGDRSATDIVVSLQASDGAIAFGPLATPRPTRSIAVEDLSPDEAATVGVDVVATRVDPGTYPLFATAQYRVDADSREIDRQNVSAPAESDQIVETSGPTMLEVEITDAPSFDVTPVGDGVPIDGERSYAVRIENVDDERVTGVTATIEAGPPLSSESPTAYVGALEGGESETVRFGLESSSDAVETTTSVALSLSYDAGSGERASADPVQVPVAIVEEDDDADVDSVGPFIAVGLVLVLAAIWWVRRR
ncbi:COG1361 S-layer family protein [Halostagnicola kamekurae]|uniref:Uncharacterized protein n=1 Tax=Halostagnicola kamekurae TaxID=619731 RepID=A0A1I6TEW8_9EURY|nr:hypothetical protein [Halostagnicola kamekurae]SFS87733.1 hypothetical protein SAMN04488556_3058 [Halostagnicola kamekurae]